MTRSKKGAGRKDDEDEHTLDDFPNEYAGYHPGQGETEVPVVRPDIDPREFFERFVATRRPCILDGALRDEAWKGSLWTDEYLEERAGSAHVRVEARLSRALKPWARVSRRCRLQPAPAFPHLHLCGTLYLQVRPSSEAGFGAGRYDPMPFRSFMERFRAGDEMLYLTTEATKMDRHGRLAVVSSPITHLLGDLPLTPNLAGNLVTANINLWMGRAKDGASSGLHHDWHDNLYVLLRGRKRFQLYSPKDTGRMYVNGKVERVHANGRINYEGNPSRADGADSADMERVARLEVTAAEAAVAAAERAAAAGEPGAKAALRAAEARLDAALAASLEAPGGGADIFIGRDDYSDDDDDDDDDAQPCGGGASAEEDDDAEPPPHFSRVDRARLAEFPLFAKAREVVAEVNAGQMLFIPAGWFHEVTSFSVDGGGGGGAVASSPPESPPAAKKRKGARAEPSAAGASLGGGHLAVNFWFHPPDVPGSSGSAAAGGGDDAGADDGKQKKRKKGGKPPATGGTFEAPYMSDLWTRDFDAWRKEILPEVVREASGGAGGGQRRRQQEPGRGRKKK